MTQHDRINISTFWTPPSGGGWAINVLAHIIVSGMVQGVGYRYFVQRAATRLQLAGRVRNLCSGEVEIEAEGPRGLIESLIKELRTGNPFASVRNVSVKWETFTGKYSGFDITR